VARILSTPAALAVATVLGSILRAFVQALPGSAGLLLLVAGVALYDPRLAVLAAALLLLVIDWRRSQ
jgi:hypothetical protein